MRTQLTNRGRLRVVLCILALGCRVWAGGFLDDFSDGDIQDASPVTWRWDASMGKCVVTPEGLQVTPTWPGPNPGAELYVFAQDAYGRDVHYAGNVTVRARVKVPESTEGYGSNAFVCLRTGDAAGGGYLLGINRLYFHIQRLDGYSPPDWYSPWQWDSKMNGRFDPAQDVMIQFDVIDLTDVTGNRTTSRLEGRWWLPGQEMPAQPQVVATDAKFDAGGIAIGNVYLDGLNSGVSFRWVEVIGTQIEIVSIADFNGDGTVDMKDLLKLIEAWGQDDPAVDIVPDGIVDKKDLEALMDHWQQDVNDPTLVAHWALDETEGVVAHDSAATNDGTVMGLPTWQPTGGAVDGALEFDGMTSLVADGPLSPSDGPFSVLAWVRGGAPGQGIIAQQGGVNWLMADPAAGAVMTELKSIGRGGRSLSCDAIITDGDWHRIGFTWDGAARTLYVDDVLAAEDTQPGLAVCYGGVLIGCGSNRAPGTFWSGLIDDVRLYDRPVRP